MKIYIDADYKCYVLPAEGRREFDVPSFDDKKKEWKSFHSFYLSPKGYSSRSSVSGDFFARASSAIILFIADGSQTCMNFGQGQWMWGLQRWVEP